MSPEGAEIFTLSATAAFIRFNISSSYNNGNTGLSEVMFSGTPAVTATPEPGALALMGAGLLLLCARRREWI